MSDYISREAAIKAIEERSCYNCGAIPKNCEICRTHDHIKAVLNVPAADVRPVVQGEWWPAKDGYYGHVMCSACRKIESHKTDFCPNCGADMMGQCKAAGEDGADV